MLTAIYNGLDVYELIFNDKTIYLSQEQIDEVSDFNKKTVCTIPAKESVFEFIESIQKLHNDEVISVNVNINDLLLLVESYLNAEIELLQ